MKPTSTGFTPAGGLVLGTRTGDLDPGVAWYMMVNKKRPQRSDMHDLLKIESSDIRAAEAVDLFCYQVKKWIGAFAAVLNGLDTLVFSGGIGENSPLIRSRICKEFDYLGIEINELENGKNSSIISTEKSKVKVYVIPTHEEVLIAKYARQVFLHAQKNNSLL